MTITLYDLAGRDRALRFSPFCWRTKMALKHKRLDFETVPWTFSEKDKLAPTGQGRVPVIVDHGQWVADSWRIALHLDRAYSAHRPLFASEREKAHARLVMGWADTLHGAIARAAVLDIHEAIDPGDRAYFRTSREERFGTTLEALTSDPAGARAAIAAALAPAEQALADHRFLGGPEPDYCDYALFGTLMWPHVVCKAAVLDRSMRVAHWFGRMLDLHDGYGRAAATVRNGQ